MASRGHIPPSVMRQEVSVSGTHAPSGREHLLDFVYELAQMDRLREHLGIFGRLGIGVERDRGKAGDEHDLDVGVEFGSAARELNPVHLRHNDVGQQKLEGLLAQPLVSGKTVVERDDLVARILQGSHQKAAHVAIIFGKNDFCHRPAHWGWRRSTPSLSANLSISQGAGKYRVKSFGGLGGCPGAELSPWTTARFWR